jgi:hypothetical protein
MAAKLADFAPCERCQIRRSLPADGDERQELPAMATG